MYQSWVPIAAAGHRLSFLRALLVGTNPCIPRTPHKTCRLGDALTQSSRYHNLPVARDSNPCVCPYFLRPLGRRHCHELYCPARSLLSLTLVFMQTSRFLNFDANLSALENVYIYFSVITYIVIYIFFLLYIAFSSWRWHHSRLCIY